MTFIKKYRIIIAVVLPVLILVILRSAVPNRFRPDAARWAEPSVTGSNLMTLEKFNALPGEKLFIATDDSTEIVINSEMLKIPASSILDDRNIKIIRDHQGPVLLISSANGSAAKTWMILSQLGIKNIYILDNNNDSRKLKYKFTTDSLRTGIRSEE